MIYLIEPFDGPKTSERPLSGAYRRALMGLSSMLSIIPRCWVPLEDTCHSPLSLFAKSNARLSTAPVFAGFAFFPAASGAG